MLTRRYRFWTGLALVALGAALAAACDLNPQPLPPGETANGSADSGALPVAAGSGDGGNANFGGGNQDAGDGGPASEQPPPDSGEADGGDASVEADAGDAAPMDGSADGSADGSEDAQ